MKQLLNAASAANDASPKILYYQLLIAFAVSTLDILAKYIYPSVLNPGIGFGLGNTLANANFIWISVYILLLVLSFTSASKGYRKCLWILLLLGFSNFFDRVVYAAVRDYIHVGGLSFNLSDVAINVFLLIIVAVELFAQKSTHNATQKPTL